jgi:16S rRNA G1207 methylase RsmC
MYKVEYDKYDVVITNPPFSMINDFFELIKNTK